MDFGLGWVGFHADTAVVHFSQLPMCRGKPLFRRLSVQLECAFKIRLQAVAVGKAVLGFGGVLR